MKLRSLVVLCPLLLLLGCAAEEHEDLREWMREEARGMKGKVTPLPEITAFPVVAYETETLTPPFAPGKIVTMEAVADKTAPDRTRPQQPLEIFPIEDLKVMGIIMAGDVPYALIQTPPPNKPKHVRVGEYMGRSFGRITAISRDSVTVLESVKDANGAWVAQEKVLMVPKEGGR
ncbi:MAG: pilus assembly protein PilP [Sulfuritalea sp.]|nr:pilus assembly protein PilP [Sulfuritalea sp.]